MNVHFSEILNIIKVLLTGLTNFTT